MGAHTQDFFSKVLTFPALFVNGLAWNSLQGLWVVVSPGCFTPRLKHDLLVPSTSAGWSTSWVTWWCSCCWESPSSWSTKASRWGWFTWQASWQVSVKGGFILFFSPGHIRSRLSWSWYFLFEFLLLFPSSGSLCSSIFDPLSALVGASGGVYALIGGYFMNAVVVSLHPVKLEELVWGSSILACKKPNEPRLQNYLPKYASATATRTCVGM